MSKSFGYCPNCRKPRRKAKLNSSICIVDAPQEFLNTSKNDDDLKLRVWSGMKPPRISATVPLIHPDRLETVRNLLNNSVEDDALETHIDSDLSIGIYSDGGISTTRSRTEIKIYPGRNRDTFGGDYSEPQDRRQEPQGRRKFCPVECFEAPDEYLDMIDAKVKCGILQKDDYKLLYQ